MMYVYADTNFFMALYGVGPFQREARQLQELLITSNAPPLPISFLGRLEIVNALQQSVMATRTGVPRMRMSPELALSYEYSFFQELKKGISLRAVKIDESLLESQFQTLVHHHTAKEGFRTYDVLHVASAIVLECDTFWSFDTRAKKLARLAGLAVN